MQIFVCVLTSLFLAVNAMVGCPCGHRTTLLGDSPTPHGTHFGTVHHDGHGGGNEHKEPTDPDPCPHASSNYVKAQLTHIDVSPDAFLPHSAVDPSTPYAPKATTSNELRPRCRLDLSSAQIYVWHCALII